MYSFLYSDSLNSVNALSFSALEQCYQTLVPLETPSPTLFNVQETLERTSRILLLSKLSILTLRSLEYTSPESLRSPDTGILHQVDSKADLWSLGMILHKLLFFRLPYQWASTNDRPEDTSRNEENPMDKLEREVLGYMGCVSTIMLFSSALTIVGVP